MALPGDIQKIVVVPDSFDVDANLSIVRDRNDGEIRGMRKVEPDRRIGQERFPIRAVFESQKLWSGVCVAAKYAAQVSSRNNVAVSVFHKAEASGSRALVIGQVPLQPLYVDYRRRDRGS